MLSSIGASGPRRFGSRIASVEQCMTRSTRRAAAARRTISVPCALTARSRICRAPIAWRCRRDDRRAGHSPSPHRGPRGSRIEPRTHFDLGGRSSDGAGSRIRTCLALRTERGDEMAPDETAAAGDQIDRHDVSPVGHGWIVWMRRREQFVHEPDRKQPGNIELEVAARDQTSGWRSGRRRRHRDPTRPLARHRQPAK